MNLEEEDALIYSEIEEESEHEEALVASLASLGIDEDEELSADEEEGEASVDTKIQSLSIGIGTPNEEGDIHHHQSCGLKQNTLLMLPLKAQRSTGRKTCHQNKKRGKLWTIRDEANWACEQLQEKQYLLMAQVCIFSSPPTVMIWLLELFSTLPYPQFPLLFEIIHSCAPITASTSPL